MLNSSIGRMNRIIANIILEQWGYGLMVFISYLTKYWNQFGAFNSIDHSQSQAVLPEKPRAAGR